MLGLRELFGKSRQPRRPASPGRNTFRPGLEALEDRQLLSATSAWLPLHPSAYDRPLFFGIGKYTGQVVFGGTAGNGWAHTIPGSPKNITDVSAGVAHDGAYDVFARDSSGGVWEWGTDTGGSWRSLGGRYFKIAAGNHGEVFALGSDLNVYENASGTPSGWVKLPGLRAYGDLSVGVDASGNDQVFAISEDRHSIIGHTANPANAWFTTVSDLQYDFTTLSATRDNQVWAVNRSRDLMQISLHFYWFHGPRVFWAATNWGGGGGNGITSISAGTDAQGRDVVYVTDRYQIVSSVEPSTSYGINGWHYEISAITDVAGGVNGYYFVVTARDSTPWAHVTPQYYGQQSGPSFIQLKPSDSSDPWSAWVL
jgi:hypothetical protein